MASAGLIDRVLWAIARAPRELLLYAIVSLGTYAYQFFVPYESNSGDVRIPWEWVLISAIFIVLLYRRMRLAWFLSLMLNILMTVLLIMSLTSYHSLQNIGLVVLYALGVVLLASSAVRRYMDGKPV